MTATVTQSKQSRTHLLSLAAVGLSALLTLVLSLLNGPQTIDDAFITYRYAENLSNGLGFVFNREQPVLGTTTPLYTLVLSAFRLLGLDIVQVSLVVGSLAAAGSTCLVYLYTQQLGGTRTTAVLSAALLAVAFPATMGVGNGMEAHLFVLLVLSSLILSSLDRPLAAVALASLAALLRPEGALAVVLVLILTCVRSRSALKSSLVTLVIMTAPWLIFASVYFGSPIPNSVQAKSGDAFSLVTALPEGGTTRRLFDHFNASLFGPVWELLSADLHTSIWALGWLISVIAIGVAITAALRRGSRSIVLLGFPAAYLSFHFLSGLSGVSIQSWYMSPLTPFYISMALTGIEVAGRLSVRVHWPAVSIAAFVLLLAGQVSAMDLGQGDRVGLSTRSEREREQLYASAALDLDSEVRPDTVIAAPEIGALGYYSSASILDTIGLVSPESAPYYPLDPREITVGVENAVPTRLIIDLRPDYIVSLEIFIRDSLLKSDEFAKLYELERTYPTAAFGSKGLHVFRLAQ